MISNTAVVYKPVVFFFFFCIAIIQILAQSVGSMLNSVSAAGKVFEYLDRKPQVSTDGELKPDAMKGHVTFQQVNFAYPTFPQKIVLQVRLNLQVEHGSDLSLANIASL